MDEAMGLVRDAFSNDRDTALRAIAQLRHVLDDLELKYLQTGAAEHQGAPHRHRTRRRRVE